MGEDYEPNEIVFDDKGAVKAGTIKALIARLTPHGSTGKFHFSSESAQENVTLIRGRYGIPAGFPVDVPFIHIW